MRRTTLWTAALTGLATGVLAFVGGTAIGGQLGPLAAGYGLLVAIAAVYALTGLAIRERVWRRAVRPGVGSTRVQTLAGRRLF